MIDGIRQNHILISEFVKYGYLGVQLFFMISGFVIFMTVDKKNSPISFFVARAIRLYPAYILSMLTTCIALYFISDGPVFTLRDIAANFTMFADTLGFRPINSAYWSLGVEIIFYFIIFSSLFFYKETRKIMNIMLIWLLIAIFNIFKPVGILEQALILKYCPFFVCGASFYLYMKHNSSLYIIYAFIALPISIYYGLVHSSKLATLFTYFQFSNYTVSLIIVCFFSLFWFISCNPKKGSTLNSKVINCMAGSSYIIYLIHETAGKLLIKKNIEQGLFIVALSIISVLILSTLIYIYIEVPIQSKIKSSILQQKGKNIKSA